MKIKKLLQETIDMIINVETKDNTLYRGTVVEIDDNMNVILKDCEITINNKVEKMDKMILRGSRIKYFILPPILKYCPFIVE